MPHYADGTPAKIGDVVTGKGYNVKEPIAGTVVGVVEGSESCNLRVAYLAAAFVRAADSDYDRAKPTGHVISGANLTVIDSVPLQVLMEYGDTKGFTKIA